MNNELYNIDLSDINLVIYKSQTSDYRLINNNLKKNNFSKNLVNNNEIYISYIYINIESIGYNYHNSKWIIYKNIEEGTYNYINNIDILNISDSLKDKINKKIYKLLGIDNISIYKIINPDNSINLALNYNKYLK